MERKNGLIYFIIFILIIIIILSFWFSATKIGKIEDKYLLPTGNVDVFNIDINCDCIHDKNKLEDKDETESINTDKAVNNANSKTNNTYPVWEEEEKFESDTVYVDDKNGNYIYQQSLNIFSNAAYELKNVIAPGTSNSYYFVVHNGSDFNTKYYIEMYEENDYKINLKYRLKENNNYLIGDKDTWVSADELVTSFSNLSMKKSDKYALDWKWDYESGNDEKDTYIGENMKDMYKLHIRFHIEQEIKQETEQVD